MWKLGECTSVLKDYVSVIEHDMLPLQNNVHYAKSFIYGHSAWKIWKMGCAETTCESLGSQNTWNISDLNCQAITSSILLLNSLITSSHQQDRRIHYIHAMKKILHIL